MVVAVDVVGIVTMQPVAWRQTQKPASGLPTMIQGFF